MSRRSLLGRAGLGLGGIALESLLRGNAVASMPGLPHYAPKAKRVIFLCMSGGASHLESFDHKPVLTAKAGTELPDSMRPGQRLPGMSGLQSSFALVGSAFPFAQYGQSGAWISDRFPQTAKVADDLCILKSAYTDSVNHDPALTLLQTGSPIAGRPSMGAWLSYGLGSENADLPAFIVLITKKAPDQPLSAKLWDAGFLPSQYQGVSFRASKDPVLFLSDPAGFSPASTRRVLDTLRALHEEEKSRDPDAALDARIAQYEMAGRLQTSVPAVTSVSGEPEHIYDLYGADARTPGTFAANCLLARRLAEKGVRFIQLFHPGWDHHGHLPMSFQQESKDTDQACAALITDLKQRGLLKDTLVVWGGEFGRTPYSQGRVSKDASYGRDHHPRCMSMWMAGGGVKPGMSYGETDDLGFNVADKPVHLHDVHATMLHLLGIDHERFTFRYQGRDFRLTDVSGKVVKDILA
jgi:uncharacterized protein (DUF1501 family)